MKLALLGATGSIGVQTLEVLDGREGVSIVALAAGTNLKRLAQQVQRWCPPRVAVAGPEQASQLAHLIDPSVEILHGSEGLVACAAESGAQVVVNALVGARGLAPTLAALEAGADVALANKESLVVGGPLVEAARRRGGGRLLPIDSEHSALWQLLLNRDPAEVARVWLTASGGALRDWDLQQLKTATPQDVLQHPNWTMGARITVDSATLVNKAFEVIEARWLFDLPFDRIGALLHPQSVVHGMVELRDGAVLAHLGAPDMKVPIQYALSAPRHRPLAAPRLDWRGLELRFDLLDPQRYPAYATVLAAGQAGGTAPAVANAADEVLVARFLKGEIPFTRIAQGLVEVLARHAPEPITLAAVEAADVWARAQAARL